MTNGDENDFAIIDRLSPLTVDVVFPQPY